MTDSVIVPEGTSSKPDWHLSLGSEEWILVWTVIIAVAIGLVLNAAVGDRVQHSGWWIFGTFVAAGIAVVAMLLGVAVERRAAKRERDLLAKLDKVRQEDSSKFRL